MSNGLTEEQNQLVKKMEELEIRKKELTRKELTKKESSELSDITKILNKTRARVHWLKSQESFEVAQYCYMESHFNNCVTRSYYAVYQGLATVLKANGHFYEKSKSHKAVIDLFTKNYVTNGETKKIFDKELIDNILHMKFERTLADYMSYFVSSDSANILLNMAKDIFFLIEETLEKKINFRGVF